MIMYLNHLGSLSDFVNNTADGNDFYRFSIRMLSQVIAVAIYHMREL